MIDILNDFIHKHFGLYKYRPSIKVRTDAFYQFLPNQSKKDQELLARLGNTIAELSDECFNACIDPMHKYYTFTQERCVKKCTSDYFTDFEKIVLKTTNRIKNERKQNIKEQN